VLLGAALSSARLASRNPSMRYTAACMGLLQLAARHWCTAPLYNVRHAHCASAACAQASGGEEFFLSFETADEQTIFGFLRLRLSRDPGCARRSRLAAASIVVVIVVVVAQCRHAR
jgi:hypothetical protein